MKAAGIVMTGWATAALLASSVTHAAQWEVVSQSNARVVEIDRSTQRVDASTVRVWERERNAMPQGSPLGQYDRLVNFVQIDCAQSAFVVRSSTLYLRDQQIAALDDTAGPIARGYIEPDSALYAVSQAVCPRGE